MRLHRLRLKHFRGVVDREVTFPDSGVVVLQGANEVGKTSMVEALDLLLNEKDSSTKAQVRSVKPVGVDVGSEVEVELSTGPYRITYRKRWHVRPRTELTVHSPVRTQLSGVPAHERVRAILDETMDDGLWKALRLLQGAPLLQGALTGSTALQAALDAAAGDAGGRAGSAGAPGSGGPVLGGADRAGTGRAGTGGAGTGGAGTGGVAQPGAAVDDLGSQGSLVEAVEAEYCRYFTPTGRQTGAYALAVQQLTVASQAAVEAGRELQEVTTDVDRHADIAAELGRLEVLRGDARGDLSAAEVRWARAELLEADLRRRGDEAAAARKGQASATAALRRRHDHAADVQRRQGSIEALALQLDAGTREVAEIAASVAQAEEAVALARGRLTAVRAEADSARRHAEHLQDRADLARLDSRLDLADTTTGDVERCRGRLVFAPVTEEDVWLVERATQAFEAVSARRNAVAPVVLVEALVDVDLDVGGERLSLPGGRTDERSATESMTVSLPGSLRVTVRPGSDAHELADAVTTAGEALRTATERAGVADLAEARVRFTEHRDAVRDLAAAERALADALGTARLADLRRTRDELAARCRTSACGRIGSGADEDPRPGATRDPDAEVTAARSRADAARGLLEEADAVVEAAATDCEVARQRLAGHMVALASLEATLAAGRAELEREAARLADARTGEPDDELDAAVAAAREAADVAAEAEATAWSALDAADRPELERLLHAARASADRLSAEWDGCRLALAQVSGRLESAGAQGRQDRYHEAMSRLDAAQRAHTAVERRARAAEHLRTVLLRHRDAARGRYVAPFAKQVTALGEVVFGPSFAIEVTDDLRIASRTLEGTTVGWDLLSTGAKEQLAIITRLACASLVDEADGVPVIFDDALGYSDPDRLSRVADVVALAGRRSQVIVLTCTPDRYRTISDATVVRLGA